MLMTFLGAQSGSDVAWVIGTIVACGLILVLIGRAIGKLLKRAGHEREFDDPNANAKLVAARREIRTLYGLSYDLQDVPGLIAEICKRLPHLSSTTRTEEPIDNLDALVQLAGKMGFAFPDLRNRLAALSHLTILCERDGTPRLLLHSETERDYWHTQVRVYVKQADGTIRDFLFGWTESADLTHLEDNPELRGNLPKQLEVRDQTNRKQADTEARILDAICEACRPRATL